MKKNKSKPNSIQIDSQKCAHFASCYAGAKCREKAISQSFPRALPKVNMESCTLCGDCIPACPAHAVSFVYAA